MRITIVGGPFLPMPPAPSGAVERVWQGLAEEFVRRGHAVTILCRAGPGQEAKEILRGVGYLRRGSFRSGRLPVNLARDFIHSLRMAALLPPADILVSNTFWLPVLAAFVDPSRGRLAVHVARMPKGQMALYERARRLQAVSRAVRDAIVEQRPRLAARVRVLPNPIDTDTFSPPARPRPLDRPPVILYAGRIHPEKGICLLVEAFRRLSPRHGARLRIVGPWRPEQGGGGLEYLADLKRRAAGAAVEFQEPVFDRRALAALYHEADLFCYPSVAERGETFGVAPLEAMATGLVPVVSNLACFRDFIRPGETARVFDHRAENAVDQLSQSLADLLANPAARQQAGTKAVATAAAFSYPRIADLYLADFAEMLDR